MKKIIAIIFAAALFAASTGDAFAEYVRGYTKKNGTYVSGYQRSDSNSTVTDNYSFKGNTNPYTGQTGSNYYRNDASSPYYEGSNGFGGTSKKKSYSGSIFNN